MKDGSGRVLRAGDIVLHRRDNRIYEITTRVEGAKTWVKEIGGDAQGWVESFENFSVLHDNYRDVLDDVERRLKEELDGQN